jgi:hypothetical protein
LRAEDEIRGGGRFWTVEDPRTEEGAGAGAEGGG